MADCNSCGIPVVEKGGTVFKCPNCGAASIGRCGKCRDQGVPYHCPDCDFRGP